MKLLRGSPGAPEGAEALAAGKVRPEPAKLEHWTRRS